MVTIGYGFWIEDNEIVFGYQNKELARFPIKFNPLTGEQVIKIGKWEYWDGWVSNHDQRIDAICSICGYKLPTVRPTKDKPYTPDNLPNYCANCGAKMARN